MGIESSKNENITKSNSRESKKEVSEDGKSAYKTIQKRVNLEVFKDKQIYLISEFTEVLNYFQLRCCVKVFSFSIKENEMKITETMLDRDINSILSYSNINKNIIFSGLLESLIEIDKLGFKISNIYTSDVFVDKNNNIQISNLYKNCILRKSPSSQKIKEKIIEETNSGTSLLLEELEIEINEKSEKILTKSIIQLMKDNDFYFRNCHKIDLELSIINSNINVIESYIDEQINECCETEGSKEFKMFYKRTGYIAMEYILNKAVSLSLIVKLIINSNDIGDIGLSYLSELLKFIPHLSVLWLGDNKITSNGFIPFTKSLYNIKELKELNINWNNISDDGMNSFCKYLCDISNIEVLYIGSNNISDKGITFLCDSISFVSNLRELDISNNRITNNGCNLLFDKLCECKNLQLVSIAKNNVNASKLSNKLKSFHSSKNLNIRM